MNTRDALITVATDLLDEGGVEGVTLREVGRRAGVSHNAPYKHFADKQALLAAVAARELSALAALMTRTTATAASPEKVLHRVMHGYVDWAVAHPARFSLVFGEWSTETPELTEVAGATWTHMVDTVAAAQDAGGLPVGNPERLAALIRSVAHGAVALALTGHLSPEGKGAAGPADLVDDLFEHLRPN